MIYVVILLHFFALPPPFHPPLTDAVEKSARAAGVPMAMVEKFSADVAHRLPGNCSQPPWYRWSLQ